VSREDYLDERGKFRPKNKGGGRPKTQRPQDYEPKVEPTYRKLIAKACELRGVSDESKLSPNVKVFLESWRMLQIQAEMIMARKMTPNDQKLLISCLAGARQSLKDALDMAAKEGKMEKEKGKGGKKRVY